MSTPPPQLLPPVPRRGVDPVTSLLDPDWRPGAWDAEHQILLLDRDDPWIISFCCRANGCDYQPRNRGTQLCQAHQRAWEQDGRPELKPWSRQVRAEVERLCRVGRGVNRCQRPAEADGLCHNHAEQLRVGPWTRERLEQEADPLPEPAPCSIAHCPRRSRGHRWRGLGLCGHHVNRAAYYFKSRPTAALEWWTAAVAPMRSGALAFAGLSERAQNEVLFGLQQAQRHERTLGVGGVRAVIEWLRDGGITSCLAPETENPPLSSPARDFLLWTQRRLRWHLTSPEEERRKDVWDLMVFDHTDAGRARGRTLDFTGIHQDWLREAAKSWAYAKLPTTATYWPKKVLADVVLLSDAIAAGPTGGRAPADVGRDDIERFFHLVRNRRQPNGKPYSGTTLQACVHHVRSFLQDAATLGLLNDVPPGFAVLKGEGVKVAVTERDVGRRSIPEAVITELDNHLHLLGSHPVRGPAADLGPQLQRLAYELLRDTGRRVSEIAALRLDCLWRDNDGSPWLIYDNAKSRRLERRIPIFEALATSLEQTAQQVAALFPATSAAEVALFPAQVQNRHGRRHMPGSTIRKWLHIWVEQIPGLADQVFDDDGELRAFPELRVHPHAFRHAYAQRLADSGAPLDVTQKLMDHGSPTTTQGYYEVSRPRLRKAVQAVEQITIGRDGLRPCPATSSDPVVTTALRAIAVPYGLCKEPSNVKAGGQQCPIRYQCAGCGHFETNPSYLPELRARLDELLKARETGLAMGAAEWALPHQQEIDRYREMIADMEEQLARLSDDERRTIDDAATLLRQARRSQPVFLGATIGRGPA
ncbi:tyrosine-type recombinase/integrase [Streptomyces sp. NPDC046900]|uniref:tyrosine-type recombinase/integrase n=1 Tax=Streptomyces sp. NPDC046900 TaxID=3155473 RepID=UPI0033DED699